MELRDYGMLSIAGFRGRSFARALPYAIIATGPAGCSQRPKVAYLPGPTVQTAPSGPPPASASVAVPAPVSSSAPPLVASARVPGAKPKAPLGLSETADSCELVHDLPGRFWMQALAATDYAARTTTLDQTDKLCALLRQRLRPNPPESMTCLAQAVKGVGDRWATIVKDVPTDTQRGMWFLAHVSPDGGVTRSGSSPWSSGGDPAVPGNSQPTAPELVSILDYDHDGTSEAITATTAETDTAGNQRQEVRIWTSRDGKVVAYPPSRGLNVVGLADQDDDGRPDLVIDPHHVTVGSVNGWLQAKIPWSLLAHARDDGTFSLDDAVAQAYARWLCPQPPDLARGLPDDPQCWAGAAHCANLWGVPPKNVADGLASKCRRLASDEMTKSWCEHSLDDWTAMARRALPIKLRP